jgi:hypothetical protein
MTEATAAASPPPSPVSLTTVENLFSITHQFIDQYREYIFLFAGTGTLFNDSQNSTNQYFSSNDSMAIQ